MSKTKAMNDHLEPPDQGHEVVDTIPVTLSSIPLTLVDPISTSVYQKNLIMKKYVQDFTYQENRKIFTTIRAISQNITPDTLFPKKGFVAGEFATYHLLSNASSSLSRDKNRRRSRQTLTKK